MVEINASMVKELREKTGVGMMECKAALAEANGDIEIAIDCLRKKGTAVAEKKAGRVASQGLVGVKVVGNKGAMVELNSETDFVAKNEEFQAFLNKVLDAALAADNGDGVMDAHKDELNELIAKIGENMSLRRLVTTNVAEGVVVPYIHTQVAPGLGKIGVLVSLNSAGNAEKLQEAGKKVAMHVAAANPRFLTVNDVDADTLAREKEIYSEQARSSGKPEAIIEKMVEGRMRKFFEEAVLVEQAFIMDPDKRIKDVIADVEKEVACPVTLSAFSRFELGEGLAKKEENFAEEVSKQLNG